MKRILEANIIIIFLFLYIPIFVVIVFSFNSGDQISVWEGFSLTWYGKLLKNPDVWRACKNSLIIAGIATLISTVIGTAAALAIEKYRFRFRTALIRALFLPMIIPDIVLAIAVLTFYRGMINYPLGLTSIIFAHVVFNIAYVTIVVRARLEGYDPTVEVGLFSFIDIHFIKLTVSKGFDAYSFILSAIRVMP